MQNLKRIRIKRKSVGNGERRGRKKRETNIKTGRNAFSAWSTFACRGMEAGCLCRPANMRDVIVLRPSPLHRPLSTLHQNTTGCLHFRRKSSALRTATKTAALSEHKNVALLALGGGIKFCCFNQKCNHFIIVTGIHLRLFSNIV